MRNGVWMSSGMSLLGTSGVRHLSWWSECGHQTSGMPLPEKATMSGNTLSSNVVHGRRWPCEVRLRSEGEDRGNDAGALGEVQPLRGSGRRGRNPKEEHALDILTNLRIWPRLRADWLRSALEAQLGFAPIGFARSVQRQRGNVAQRGGCGFGTEMNRRAAGR